MSTAEYQSEWRKRNYIQGPLRFDATGTRRRLQALGTMGWSLAELSRLTGSDCRERFTDIASGDRSFVFAPTRDLVNDLYERLSMRSSTARMAGHVRRMALAKGWAPPLAWDEGDIDEPDATPNTGEAPTSRSYEVTAEEYVHLRAFGYTPAQIARRLGIKLDTLQRALRSAA